MKDNDYYKNNRAKILERVKKHYNIIKNTKEYKFRSHLNIKLRLKINKFKCIFHYSNGTLKCKCCSQDIYEFLTIEHDNNNGAEHRRKYHINNIYDWLIRNNYPKGFSILCFNCNCTKGFLGECPHVTFKY